MRNHPTIKQANGFRVAPIVKKELYLRAILLIDQKLILKDFPRNDEGTRDAEEWLLDEAARHPEAETISGHVMTCADRKEE